jgi:hypothetical protein
MPMMNPTTEPRAQGPADRCQSSFVIHLSFAEVLDLVLGPAPEREVADRLGDGEEGHREDREVDSVGEQAHAESLPRQSGLEVESNEADGQIR